MRVRDIKNAVKGYKQGAWSKLKNFVGMSDDHDIKRLIRFAKKLSGDANRELKATELSELHIIVYDESQASIGDSKAKKIFEDVRTSLYGKKHIDIDHSRILFIKHELYKAKQSSKQHKTFESVNSTSSSSGYPTATASQINKKREAPVQISMATALAIKFNPNKPITYLSTLEEPLYTPPSPSGGL